MVVRRGTFACFYHVHDFSIVIYFHVFDALVVFVVVVVVVVVVVFVKFLVEHISIVSNF